MKGHQTSQAVGFLQYRYGIVTVAALLVIAIMGILGFAVRSAHDQKLHRVIMELANGQSVTNQKHLKEILLRMHGAKVDHHSTRKSLHTSWDVLTNGGSVIVDPHANEIVNVPPAPNKAIRMQLLRQKRLIDEFALKADQFLRLDPSDEHIPSMLGNFLSLMTRSTR